MTSPTVAVSVCSNGDVPATMMVSSTAPSCRLKSILTIALASTGKTSVVTVLNPASSAFTM
jgi:hypothetical protein